MKFRYVYLFSLFVLAVAEMSAITPREAADAIVGRNGQRLQALVVRDAKDLESYTIANAPDPEIEGGYKVAPSGVEDRWDVGISYGVEWPGVYGARRKVGKATREANAAEEDAVVYAKRIEIIQKICEWMHTARRLDLMRNIAAATDSLETLTERGMRGGQMSRLDFSKISIEKGKVDMMIADIEAEKISLEGDLTTLNGGYSCIALLESIDLTPEKTSLLPLQEYLDGVKANPIFRQAAAGLRIAEGNVKVAKAEGLPGFSLGYAHDYEDGYHFNGANLGVSIPLFSNRGKVKAAKASKAAAEFQMTVAADEAESEIRSLYDEICALDKALRVLEEVFSSTDYTSLLMKSYNGGEISLTEYLQELAWFQEAHLDFLQLQSRREQAMHLLSASRCVLLPEK